MRNVLSDLVKELAQLKKKEHTASELLNFMFQQFKFAFSNVDKHVKLLEQYVDHLSLTFASLLLRLILLKKSRKELFSRRKSLFALKSISRKHPTNLALTIEAQLDIMPRFYQDTKVSVSVTTHRVLYENGITVYTNPYIRSKIPVPTL